MKRKSEYVIHFLLFVFLQFCAIVLNVSAQENITFIVSGKPISIKLYDQPVITYMDNTLHIESWSNVIDINVSNINYIVFKNEDSVSITQQPFFEKQNGEYLICQQTPGSKVLLFTVSGIKLAEEKADVNGKVVINIGSLAKGTYILRSIMRTFKYVKK